MDTMILFFSSDSHKNNEKFKISMYKILKSLDLVTNHEPRVQSSRIVAPAKRKSIVKFDRAGGALEFSGRVVKGQKFFIASFPGQYEKEWEEFIHVSSAAAEPLPIEKEQRLSTSCCFFPDDSSDYAGLHCKDCKCRFMYEGNHPLYSTWPDRKAPWGCVWFEQWKTNTRIAAALDQIAVVVYTEGRAGDDKQGLGYSQRGEVRWLKEEGIKFVKWDIRDFVNQASLLAMANAAPYTYMNTCKHLHVRHHSSAGIRTGIHALAANAERAVSALSANTKTGLLVPRQRSGLEEAHSNAQSRKAQKVNRVAPVS